MEINKIKTDDMMTERASERDERWKKGRKDRRVKWRKRKGVEVM